MGLRARRWTVTLGAGAALTVGAASAAWALPIPLLPGPTAPLVAPGLSPECEQVDQTVTCTYTAPLIDVRAHSPHRSHRDRGHRRGRPGRQRRERRPGVRRRGRGLGAAVADEQAVASGTVLTVRVGAAGAAGGDSVRVVGNQFAPGAGGAGGGGGDSGETEVAGAGGGGATSLAATVEDGVNDGWRLGRDRLQRRRRGAPGPGASHALSAR